TFKHENTLPKDFSFPFLLAHAVTLAIYRLKARTVQGRSVLSFGLAYTVALSITLIASGKFPTYYGWMTYIPLAVCVCATLDQCRGQRAMRWLSRAFALATIGSGIGLHAAAA